MSDAVRRRMRVSLALSFFAYALLALLRALSPHSVLADDALHASLLLASAAIGGVWLAACWLHLEMRPRVERFLDWFEWEARPVWHIVLAAPMMLVMLLGAAATMVATLAPILAPPPAAGFALASLSAWIGTALLRRARRMKRDPFTDLSD